jgi:hypothetical protein
MGGFKESPTGNTCPVGQLIFQMECTRTRIETPVTCAKKDPLPTCCSPPPPPPSPPPDPPTNCHYNGIGGDHPQGI